MNQCAWEENTGNGAGQTQELQDETGMSVKMRLTRLAKRTGQKEYSALPLAPMEPAAEKENLFVHWIWAIPSTAARGNASLDCPVVTTVCCII